MTEHAGPDHLKALGDLRWCFLFVINRQPALDLCLHSLLSLGQHAGDALNASVIGESGDAVPPVREMLVLQIRLQLALGQAHGYVTHAKVFIRVVA